SIPIAKATHPDTLLAYEMNGEPLPPPHGFPLRLLVPGWYGMTSIKWLVGIHVLDHEFQGFYQKQRYMTMNEPGSEIAYTAYTTMKIKSIITNPAPGEIVPTGDYIVAGKAWSGEDDVVKVEISSDGGETWDDARITVQKSGYSWYRWEYTWTAPGPGRYVLKSRATNNKGETQPMEFPNKWDGRGYGNNMVFPHDVEVRDR
ncbi:MAG: molybdopterin-dependent oxidoreductase, partial [Chloroflexi bacterium]|nr:molybdopterin-dependent oxidoreductase [Chloroflexota bacterium]